MAVRPSYQQKGFGWRILEEVNQLAQQKHCEMISLECFEPLKRAVRLYEKFGFVKTGRERDYHGIIVFEMLKQVV